MVLASSGEMTPRTQKRTWNLTAGYVTDRNRVRIDGCIPESGITPPRKGATEFSTATMGIIAPALTHNMKTDQLAGAARHAVNGFARGQRPLARRQVAFSEQSRVI